MKNYAISETVLHQLISYLEGRPYREVAQAVALLRSLPQVPAQEGPGQ